MTRSAILEKVIDLPTMEKSKERKVITADFSEMDDIRRLIKTTVKALNRIPAKRKYGCYNVSYFYIGRHTANLNFYDLKVSAFQMKQVVTILKRYYTHDLYVEGRNLRIYMRGKKRS